MSMAKDPEVMGFSEHMDEKSDNTANTQGQDTFEEDPRVPAIRRRVNK